MAVLVRSTPKMSRWIVISPHLDDGVLSCGGLIRALSSESDVEVWTLFAGAPWFGPYSGIASWLHSVSGGKRGVWLARARRSEDRAACRMLGATFRHFRWHDAVYRSSTAGEFLYSDCRQTQWVPEDNKLITRISKKLQQLLKPDDRLIVPLAIGSHVDHLIAKVAAEQARHPLTLYYPDVPYHQRYPKELAALSKEMISVSYKINEVLLSSWIESVNAYSSQMQMLEDASGHLGTLLRTYAAENLQLFTVAAKAEDVVGADLRLVQK
jgi:LmbE family N-acetylglucosaminyl deacetylase